MTMSDSMLYFDKSEISCFFFLEKTKTVPTINTHFYCFF